MLLRRMTQHVKDQNWFAVGLDFLIVVIGVFIGLQVNNWNQSSAEGTRIAAQLASFREELILARDDLAIRQAYYQDRVESVAELRQRLESGNDFAADDFNQLTVSAIRGSALNVTFRGYEEMTTTGAISKVADQNLRDLLYKWDTILTSVNNSDETLENTRNNVIIPIVIEATALGNTLQTDDRYQELTVTQRFAFDIDDIRTNRALDGALALRQVQAGQQLNALEDFIATTEDLIAALETGSVK